MLEIVERLPIVPTWIMLAAATLTMCSYLARWWWGYRPMPAARRYRYMSVALGTMPLVLFYVVVIMAEDSGATGLAVALRPLNRWSVLSLCAVLIINSSVYQLIVTDFLAWIGLKH